MASSKPYSPALPMLYATQGCLRLLPAMHSNLPPSPGGPKRVRGVFPGQSTKGLNTSQISKPGGSSLHSRVNTQAEAMPISLPRKSTQEPTILFKIPSLAYLTMGFCSPCGPLYSCFSRAAYCFCMRRKRSSRHCCSTVLAFAYHGVFATSARVYRSAANAGVVRACLGPGTAALCMMVVCLRQAAGGSGSWEEQFGKTAATGPKTTAPKRRRRCSIWLHQHLLHGPCKAREGSLGLTR